ncbi:MAG TPA: right-handed parallel beta-helix repeat-containing protein [Nitrospiria bacterium]|nr:right-handed parallel beta-helix repeat-containing protein [Nitrospiria bacterium]
MTEPIVTPAVLEPPPNPKGGKTLIVDAKDDACYPGPSLAFKEAGPNDQIFLRPGAYEDSVFIAARPVRLIGAGRDHVTIFCRRRGPIYLQQVPEGLVSGITFRYVGSDQHSAMNVLDSSCTITGCRVMEGILSGIVIYGPECRPTFVENEVCLNRETGIFIFAGAKPYVARNLSRDNHHFGIAVRDHESRPDLVRNVCRGNMLSGILLFQYAEALVAENDCHDNHDWGLVITPDCATTPPVEELTAVNQLDRNPCGAVLVTDRPLESIGR